MSRRRRYLTTTSSTLRATPSNLPNRNVETTSSSLVRHTTDSYAKDVDYTPAPDSQIYRVDPLNENVQKPYEAPSGEFSRTGARAAEYAMINKGVDQIEGEQGGTKS